MELANLRVEDDSFTIYQNQEYVIILNKERENIKSLQQNENYKSLDQIEKFCKVHRISVSSFEKSKNYGYYQKKINYYNKTIKTTQSIKKFFTRICIIYFDIYIYFFWVINFFYVFFFAQSQQMDKDIFQIIAIIHLYVYIFDFFFSFITYEKPGEDANISMNTAISYLKEWFLFDALVMQFFKFRVLQFFTFFEPITSIIELNNYLIFCFMFQAIKMIKLYKMQNQIYTLNFLLFKQMKVKINRFLNYFSLSIFIEKLLSLLFFIFVIMHIASCIWIYVGLMNKNESWIENDQTQNLNMQRYFVLHKQIYISSLYWVQVTLSSCGFGDIYPKTVIGNFLSLERFVATFWIMIGAMFFAFTLANFTFITRQLNYFKVHKQNILTQFMESAYKQKLPIHVVKSFEKFIRMNYKYKTASFIDNRSYLSDLSINRKRSFFFKAFNQIYQKSSLLQVDFDFTSHLIQQMMVYNIDKDKVLYRKGDKVEESNLINFQSFSFSMGNLTFVMKRLLFIILFMKGIYSDIMKNISRQQIILNQYKNQQYLVLERDHYCVAEVTSLLYYIKIEKFQILMQDYDQFHKIFIKTQEKLEQDIHDNGQQSMKQIQNSSNNLQNIDSVEQSLVSNTKYFLTKFNLIKKAEQQNNNNIFNVEQKQKQNEKEKKKVSSTFDQQESLIKGQIDVIDQKMTQCYAALQLYSTQHQVIQKNMNTIVLD